MRNFILILFCIVITSESLVAQCPTKDSLVKKLLFFRNSPDFDKKIQLNELLQYDLKIKNCSFPNDSVYTFLISSIGVTYFLLNDYVHAIQYMKQVINTIHSNSSHPDIDKKNLNKYFYFLSVFYDSLHQKKARDEAADSCIANEIASNRDYRYTAFLLTNRVPVLFFNGELNLCIDYSTLGETLIHRFYKFKDSLDFIGNFIYYKTRAMFALKKFSEAEEFLRSEKEEFGRMKNKIFVGGIYNLYGYLFKAKGDYKSAISYFEESIRQDLQTVIKATSSQSFNQIGLIYSQNLGRNKYSLQFFSKGLKYALAQDSVYILDNIANVYSAMTKFDSAFYFYQIAFDKIKTGINENDLSEHMEEFVNANNVEFVVELVLDKADAYLNQFFSQRKSIALQQASAIYKVADHLLNNINSEQSEFVSKLFWRTYTKRLYEHAIETCYFQNDINNLFYFFEKSRAVLLNDQVNQLSKIADDNDILKKAQNERKIIELETERKNSDASSARFLEIQKELITAKQELNRTEEIIKQKNPLYYQSFLDTSFITLNNVQKNLLSDHQALIELFNGDSNVYSLLITSQQTYLNKIDKKDYDNTTKSYITFISNSGLLNSHYVEYNRTAHHLYQLIFGKDDLPNGRIIISPEGEYFPFEALVINSNFQSPVYFLNDHAVSYTYSARFLLNDFSSSNTSSKNNFLGVAPVKYVSSLSLPSLNGSDKSLNEIENYFSGTDNYVSDRATKTNFTDQFSKYKVIQLYTHSSDTSSRNEPVIFFQDSALYLSELIPENKPSTQLIVLSACETANGQLYRGEGVFSFNRGFAALGIPSSVTNLWSVDDKSTYKITELFYKYLAKGLPLDVALQNAKKEFIQTGTKENSLPYYWAGPVLVGKTDAIEMNYNFSRKIFFLTAAICLLVFFAVKYFVRKRSAEKSILAPGTTKTVA
ncbi:MAG TPA: CHAT domain-containing protein [Puia sp.]